MTELLAAYTVGLITAFIISVLIHRHHKKAWQTEYRRLMGGIKEIKGWVLLTIQMMDSTDGYSKSAYKHLNSMAGRIGNFYNGDPIWPRK
jgi:hypothetical protein